MQVSLGFSLISGTALRFVGLEQCAEYLQNLKCDVTIILEIGVIYVVTYYEALVVE